MTKTIFILSTLLATLSSLSAHETAFCNVVASNDFSQSGNMDQQVDYSLLAANIINKGNIQMARSVGCSSTCSSGCSVQCSMTCSMRCGR